nr:GDP-fucose protein O-fucosyltransferase 1-like [Lytechinus pictus]
MKSMPLLYLALVILLRIDLQVSSSTHHPHEEEEYNIVHDGECTVAIDTRLEDGIFSTGGHAVRTSATLPKLKWDPNGYITFCPCMGRFGNQAEQYIGSLVYGKAMDRTIILPPFLTKHGPVPFSNWFQVEHIRGFYPRIITMETFMSELAPIYWPENRRVGYCCSFPGMKTCGLIIKEHISVGLWNAYDITFVDEYALHCNKDHADFTDENNMAAIKDWGVRNLPSDKHPVVMMTWPPAPFPMLAGNRIIQRYFKWNFTIFGMALHHMDHLFHGEPFIGIHLRTGQDWEIGCRKVEGMGIGMASSQCRDITKDPVTMVMCYPTKELVLEETRAAVEKFKTRHVFIATDKLSYQTELQKLFGDKVKVHHLDPDIPQIDLIILGQSDFFIGNCVSSFTSFVKRERDANGKPSSFWSFGLQEI